MKDGEFLGAVWRRGLMVDFGFWMLDFGALLRNAFSNVKEGQSPVQTTNDGYFLRLVT
ncbi:hypothetical protein [Nitratifractor sp.]|uniref:hypothetical protein n=1 Tax=Nitratifractor sp. TaxID=2268144 RepID=UPI0025E92B1E|nr:hypothetical protein [Nitratifractor sp.]